MGILIEGDFRRMINIDTVANYFLSKQEMTPKKLQKMCYYAYSWYLTLYNEILFDDGKFEAWVHGPVNVKLYRKYREYGWNEIEKRRMPELNLELREFLDLIFDTFSKYTGNELETMTHLEEPWIEARKGFEPDEACNVLISDRTIKSFYSRLGEKQQME